MRGMEKSDLLRVLLFNLVLSFLKSVESTEPSIVAEVNDVNNVVSLRGVTRNTLSVRFVALHL